MFTPEGKALALPLNEPWYQLVQLDLRWGAVDDGEEHWSRLGPSHGQRPPVTSPAGGADKPRTRMLATFWRRRYLGHADTRCGYIPVKPTCRRRRQYCARVFVGYARSRLHRDP